MKRTHRAYLTIVTLALVSTDVFGQLTPSASSVASVTPTPVDTSVFDDSLFTEEDEKFIDAGNVNGYVGMCSEPFPAVSQDNYFCFYQRGKLDLHLPHTWIYCGYTNCVTNAMSAAFYLKWHLRTGNIVYRFRTAETVTEWKTFDCVDAIDWIDDVLVTRYPIEKPPYPCDMEFYTHVDDHFPYYQYVDYSGSGHGVPGYTEETFSVTNRKTSADTIRENMGSELQYVRIREFSSRFKRLLLSRISDGIPVSVQAPAEYFTYEPLGFRINWVTYDVNGVTVDFDTDLPPPYEVGVYRMMEVGLGRHKALAKVVTDSKRVTVLGDYTDVNVFVQVGTEGALGIDTVINRSTYKNYANWVRYLPQKTDERQSTIVKKNTRFVQSADGEWSAFLPCSTNVVTFSIDGEYMMPGTTYNADALTVRGYDRGRHRFSIQPYATRQPVTALTYHPTISNLTNWVVRPVSVNVPQTLRLPASVLSVGSGYRVRVSEVSNTVDLVRAYSARTNMSDAVLVPKAFKAMSTSNGYKYTTDWLGTREMKRETNYVDRLIYPKGI